MTQLTIERKKLDDLVDARLRTISGISVFGGEVPGNPPAEVTSGRVRPYVVHFGGAGGPTVDANDVAQTHIDLDWSFQLTCVAGWQPDCLRLVDQVHALFYRWVPVLEGYQFGQAKPPGGFDPGPVRPDKDVKPVRYFLPLQYQLPVTT